LQKILKEMISKILFCVLKGGNNMLLVHFERVGVVYMSLRVKVVATNISDFIPQQAGLAR